MTNTACEPRKDLKQGVSPVVASPKKEFLPNKEQKKGTAPQKMVLKRISALVAAAILGGMLCGCSLTSAKSAETTDTEDELGYVAPTLAASEASVEAPKEPMTEWPAEPTPEPTPSGNLIGTILPLETPTTARQMALWVTGEYDYANVPGTTRFQVATMTNPTDFAYVNTDFPMAVYRFPYNLDGRGDTGQFCLNKDMSAEVIADAIEVATNAALADLSVDWRDPDAYRTRAYLMRSRYEKGYEAGTEALLASYVEDKYIYRAMFCTDPSLVYTDTDGCTRVRGVIFQMLESAERSHGRMEIGKWYSRIVEYCLADQNYIADAVGVKPWDTEHIHAYDRVIGLEDSLWLVDSEAPEYQALFEKYKKGVI